MVFEVRDLSIAISKNLALGEVSIFPDVCSAVVLGFSLKLSFVLFEWLIDRDRLLNMVSVILMEIRFQGSSSSSVLADINSLKCTNHHVLID